MSLQANRRRFLAFVGLALPAVAARPLRAQTPPGIPENPTEMVIEEIGSWRVVSQANQSRAFPIDEKIKTASGGIKDGDSFIGGSAEINLEYWSVEGQGHGYGGKLTVYQRGITLGGMQTRVLVDGKEVDAFATDGQVDRELDAWFGPELDDLAAVGNISVVMDVAGEPTTVFDVNLVGTAEAMSAMTRIPDYNYIVRGLGKQNPLAEGEKPPGGCFLTTACCDVVGLGDDCFELASLRRFRDRVMASTPEGRRDIGLYYALAPLVVSEIRRRGEEWRLLGVYFSHILPSAIAARLGFVTLPRRLYSDLMRRLVGRYLPDRPTLLG